jgi:hypothetical protein
LVQKTNFDNTEAPQLRGFLFVGSHFKKVMAAYKHANDFKPRNCGAFGFNPFCR